MPLADRTCFSIFTLLYWAFVTALADAAIHWSRFKRRGERLVRAIHRINFDVRAKHAAAIVGVDSVEATLSPPVQRGGNPHSQR
jgi:hypothetical protein